jgi:hypothetical protein
MSTNNSNLSKSNSLERIHQLCQSGLHYYTDLFNKALQNNDWGTLRDLSMKFEKDCYSIGEVEIAGKLILLRLHLQSNSVDKTLVEQNLRTIFDLSLNLQHFLVKHLENSNFRIDESNLNYINLDQDPKDHVENSWVFSICKLQ